MIQSVRKCFCYYSKLYEDQIITKEGNLMLSAIAKHIEFQWIWRSYTCSDSPSISGTFKLWRWEVRLDGRTFTERAQAVLEIAQEEAKRLKHQSVSSEHVLLALVVEQMELLEKYYVKWIWMKRKFMKKLNIWLVMVVSVLTLKESFFHIHQEWNKFCFS